MDKKDYEDLIKTYFEIKNEFHQERVKHRSRFILFAFFGFIVLYVISFLVLQGVLR